MELQTDYKNRVMSVGEWVITLLVAAVPILNIVMLLIWGFGESENLNRRHFSRACLLIMVIGMGIWMITVMTIGTALMGVLGDM